MSFLRQLVKTELVGLGALCVAAGALATFSAIEASLAPSSLLGVGDSARVVFLYTLIIDCVPVVLIGAPIYSVLRYFHKINWPVTLAIGIAPGLVLFLVAADLGFFALLCGVFVAAATHLASELGSNYALKRTVRDEVSR